MHEIWVRRVLRGRRFSRKTSKTCRWDKYSRIPCFNKNFFSESKENTIFHHNKIFGSVTLMHSRVITKILFLEHLRLERYGLIKYQHMHIFRNKISFSLQIWAKFLNPPSQIFKISIFAKMRGQNKIST